MKTILLFALIFVSPVLFGSSAYSAMAPCLHLERKLVCESNYTLIDGYASSSGSANVAGPMGVDSISDRELEPFNPSQCEASVVLFTYAGRFVATYSENSDSINSWVESDGKFSVLTDEPMTMEKAVSVTVPSPFKGIVKSISFDCRLQ